MQKSQRLTQIPRGLCPQGVQIFSWHGIRQIRMGQATLYGPAQIGLRQACRRRVDGRQRQGQVTLGGLEGRMHHLPSQQATLDLATGTDPVPNGQRFLL